MRQNESGKKAEPKPDPAQQQSASSYFERFFGKKDAPDVDADADAEAVTDDADDVIGDELVLHEERVLDDVLYTDADYEDGRSEVPNEPAGEQQPRPPPGTGTIV